MPNENSCKKLCIFPWFCLFWWGFRPTRKFFNHIWIETSQLPVKASLHGQRILSTQLAIEQWGFFRVPHLLWHGSSVCNGHLWCLNVCMFKVCRSWDSNTQPAACDAKALTDCATTAAFSMIAIMKEYTVSHSWFEHACTMMMYIILHAVSKIFIYFYVPTLTINIKLIYRRFVFSRLQLVRQSVFNPGSRKSNGTFPSGGRQISRGNWSVLESTEKKIICGVSTIEYNP